MLANTESLVFYTLATLLIAFSLLVICVDNAVHSALCLVAALFLMAVIFLTLNAPMVAILQILVYAGAIMVLFLFVIMLLYPEPVEPRSWFWVGSTIGGVGLLALQLVALTTQRGQEMGVKTGVPTPDFGSPRTLAQSLFTDFVFPFEIASILLLVAIVGAVVLAKREGTP
jgi:NADH-quinone oxidoreductase subunit J